MRGLDPRIHPSSQTLFRNGWIAKPGNDDEMSEAQQ
jgi:hypothetical protein